LAEERVQQRGLADVGAPDDGDEAAVEGNGRLGQGEDNLITKRMS